MTFSRAIPRALLAFIAIFVIQAIAGMLVPICEVTSSNLAFRIFVGWLWGQPARTKTLVAMAA
jgi:hypothetical protein